MDRLDEITKNCFNALNQIRQLEAGSQPPPETLHQRLRAFIDTMVHSGAEAGFNTQDVQDMQYAIVALADEIALNMPGPIRQFWMSRPLQLHYFNENIAGEGFFTRLNSVRGNPSRIDVLRVYYLCLMFGFMGRYRARGGEVELASIIEGVEQELARAKVFGGDQLSPHGDRPQEAATRQRRSLPLVMFGLVAVLLSVGLYIGLRYSISSQSDAVRTRVDGLAR